MVCADETRKNVALLFGKQLPAPTSTFVDHLFTCTYVTPAGPLVLSVMDSADVPAASRYFTALHKRIGATHRLDGMTGLGLPAYESSHGTVTFLKDHMTLLVDASAVHGRVGPDHHTPTDLAYTLATAVLACWSED